MYNLFILWNKYWKRYWSLYVLYQYQKFPYFIQADYLFTSNSIKYLYISNTLTAKCRGVMPCVVLLLMLQFPCVNRDTTQLCLSFVSVLHFSLKLLLLLCIVAEIPRLIIVCSGVSFSWFRIESSAPWSIRCIIVLTREKIL